VFLANAATRDLLFYTAGGLKIVYDLLLYRSFIKLRPPEEAAAPRQEDGSPRT
jgi:hypothetical protein